MLHGIPLESVAFPKMQEALCLILGMAIINPEYPHETNQTRYKLPQFEISDMIHVLQDRTEDDKLLVIG